VIIRKRFMVFLRCRSSSDEQARRRRSGGHRESALRSDSLRTGCARGSQLQLSGNGLLGCSTYQS
jgi:hypothetical protein